MKKLLVHIGLPKTATTSLQENVLMQLHNVGKINYLGRCNVENYYPSRDFFNQLKDRKLSKDEIKNLNEYFWPTLKVNVVNVVSDESFSISGVTDLSVFFYNLQQLLAFYDSSLFITLRNPRDFIFSHYVEAYRWRHQFSKDKNTFKKYIECVRSNMFSTEFDTIFYSRLYNYFEEFKVKTLFYEDIKYDKEEYSAKMAFLLGISKKDFEDYFYVKQRNEREKTISGKFSEGTTLNQYLNKLSSLVSSKLPFLRKVSFVKTAASFIRRLSGSLIVRKAVEHKIPNDYDCFINDIVMDDNYKEFIFKLGLSERKIYKYGYLY